MSEKSALKLIPGKDALLEYAPIPYKAKTYVEYQGLVYKALIDTSATFIGSQWELIGDLREIRVRTIGDRNALTGSTPTSGTTGIHIPILDNTNVLVLHAQADPQVAADKFARYNYNQGTNSFLLLQVSTGSTGSNVSDYNLLTNRPPIISGITATAGAGLTGGGVFSGNVPPNRATFTFQHADTSSQPNILGTGYTYAQQLKFDTFGHVTGATSSTWVHPDTSNQPNVNNTGRTYIQSVQVDGAGHLVSLASGTWTHPDTSSQASITNTGSTVIQSISIDGDGHIISMNSATVSTGGGGVNFGVQGDSGGLVAMPNSGILRITGGTNAQTVTTVHGANVGVRINVTPAGSSGQLQLNSGGVLGTVVGLTYTGTSLNTPNLKITSLPVSGATTDQFLMRNPTTGAIQRLGLNTIAAFPIDAIQYKLSTGGFGGDNFWKFNPTNKIVTLGTRAAGGVGVFSLATGQNVVASGNSATAQGSSSKAIGNYSTAYNEFTIASGQSSHAEGQNTIAYGYVSHAEGIVNYAYGVASHAQGAGTFAIGNASHSGGATGPGATGPQYVRAVGLNSFIHSYNTSGQIAGHGALASFSAILGGQDHNIDSANTNAVVLGGSGIKLTGSTYVDHVAIPNLAIMSQPALGLPTDDVLVRSAGTGRIRRVTQASLSGGGGGTPAGSNTEIQFNDSGAFGSSSGLTFISGSNTLATVNLSLGGTQTLISTPVSGSTNDQILTRNIGTGVIQRLSLTTMLAPFNANNGITRSFNTFRLGGALTGNTTIGTGLYNLTFNTNAWTFGSRIGTIGINSMTIGQTNTASGVASTSLGVSTIASNTGSLATGQATTASGYVALAMGFNTTASGQGSFAGGEGPVAKPILANGNWTFNYSYNTNGQTTGHGALNSYAAILGGTDHNVNGAASIVLGGQTNKLTSGVRSAIMAGSNNTITAVTADGSVIIGGQTNLINDSAVSLIDASYTSQINTSTNSVIIGGNNTIINSGANIIALGAVGTLNNTYNSFVVVNSLALITPPVAGAAGTDDILVWNATDKKVKKVTQTSVATGAGNGLTKVGNTIRLGGALTGTTTISGAFNVTWTNNSNTFSTTGRGVGAIGVNSFAIGDSPIASGITSYAEGFQTRATGNYSHAEGFSTIASGVTSHAEGGGTRAGAQYAHAEGDSTRAKGSASHSEGSQSIASGNTSHAEGQSTIAYGVGSHTEGNQTKAIGQYSHAKGNLTIASAQYAYAEGNQSVASGDTSHAEGFQTRAGGQYSHAEGRISRATGLYSHAEGSGTFATGSVSHAEGSGTLASGQNSHSEGILTTASGNTSHAEGSNTVAGGQYSHAEGFVTRAIGLYSHVGGAGTNGGASAVLATGQTSFNHSENNAGQVIGHGALAANSAILGGLNHNTGVGNFRSAIIGGNGIKLTGTSYTDTTAVANLAIFTPPPFSTAPADDILMYSNTTKLVRRVSGSVYSRTAYVSPSGNNSTAAIGSQVKPYSTINAAIAALVAGSPAPALANRCLVDVSGGYYNETVVLATFVDINLNGATVNSITESSANNVNSKVFGKGNTQYEGLGGGGGIFITNTNTSSRFEFDMNIIWARQFGNASIFNNSYVTANRFESTFNAVPILCGGLYNHININEFFGSVRPVTSGDTFFTVNRHTYSDNSSNGAIVLMNYTTGQPARYTKFYYKSNTTTTTGGASPILFNKFGGNFSGETYFSGNFYSNGASNGVICTNGAGSANEIRGSAYYDGIFKNNGSGGVMRLGVNPAGVPFKTIIKGGTSLVGAGQSIYNNDSTAINVLVYGQVVATSAVGSLITPIVGSVIVNASVV